MKYLLIVLLLYPSFVSAQNIVLPLDSISGKITYKEVVKDSLTKDELYIRTKEWFARSFTSAQDVLQMDDRQAGKLIGKGTARGFNNSALLSNGFTLYYTVSIILKDGKYKYEISDFLAKNDYMNGITNSDEKYPLENLLHNDRNKKKNGEYRDFMVGYINAIDTAGKSLAESLKKALKLQPSNIKSGDDF